MEILSPAPVLFNLLILNFLKARPSPVSFLQPCKLVANNAKGCWTNLTTITEAMVTMMTMIIDNNG